MAKRRLGRGLDSLIGGSPRTEDAAAGPATAEEPAAEAGEGSGQRAPDQAPPVPAPEPVVSSEAPLADLPAGTPVEVAVGRIIPNPFQPRRDFDEGGLEELMRSIAASGIIQPLVVRRTDEDAYELVAGERRLRAATALGLETVPVVVREVPDERMLELALIENIQREDLNPIEKAEAFRDYLARYQATQEQAAERIGIDRATLANHLRLLELPEDIQALVRRKALSMSHARTIAGVDDAATQLDLAKKVIRQGWSVRRTERTVQGLQSGVPSNRRRSSGAARSAQAAALEDELRSRLGTKVRIEESRKAGQGRIVIEYYSFDDFDRILSTMRR